MIQSLSIHKKLLFISAATTLFVFIIAGSFWVFNNHLSHKADFHKRIESQGMLVANNISAAVLFDDEESKREILSALRSDPAIVSVRVFALHNNTNLLINFTEDPGESRFYRRFNHRHVNSLKVPIIEAELKIGDIEILYNDLELHQFFWSSISIIFVTALLAVFLGAAFSSRLQKIVITPILHLSTLARKVTYTKNYALRSEVFYPDEIGALSKDFNSMLDIIEAHNKNLETIVEDRTAQLIRKNQELKVQIGKREKSESARREVEAIFERAFIQAPIGMALVDDELVLIRYNKVFSEFVDLRGNDSKSLVNVLSVDCRDEVIRQFDLLTRGEIVNFDSDVKCTSISGRENSIILSASAVNNDDGSFRYGVLQFQDVTESRRLSSELEFQAKHDSLTGLANRRALNQALAEVKTKNRDHSKLHTLCVMDLDQFKTVNDTCGHMAGDELLCQVAREIRAHVRKGDLVVRLGGDEFALLLYYCDKKEAQVITEIIRKAIEELHFHWEGNTFRISASIGAMASNLADSDTSLTLQQVDSACFAAKEAGRNRVFMIDKEDAEICERQGEMQWVHRLHQAMSDNLFVIYAQPMFALNINDDTEYVEILLRLKSEKDGSIIPPGAFLPAAERYGLSVSIDQWVIQHLIDNMPRYRRAYGDKRSYWVNLSGTSISDKKFLAFLEKAIKQADLPPKMLNFEITETSVIRNMTVAKEAITRFKTLGCQFSLDDFGSGMSSFGYLKNLPIDYIKIDGMFVKDMLSDEISMAFVKSIIDIANVMGVKTIAEYVENQKILSKVIELGACYAQGYSLGLPEQLLDEKLCDELEKDGISLSVS